MIGGVVPEDMHDTLFGNSGLNFSKKLSRTDAVEGGWLSKGHIESSKI